MGEKWDMRYIDGVSSNPVDIAKEVVKRLPNEDIIFRFLHRKDGFRLVDGFIYYMKDYGVFRILNINGTTNIVTLNNGYYRLLS